MRQPFWSIGITLFIIASSLFNAIGQTTVRRYEATKANGCGVVYRLPITQVEVGFVIATTEFVPGALATYAPRFIGEKTGVSPIKTSTIENVALVGRGLPDESAEFVASFKSSNSLSYLTLTKDGILHSINGEPNGVVVLREGDNSYMLGEKEREPKLPENRVPKFATPALPKEYSLATSQLKQAEIASDRLFEIKEDLLALLSGKVETMPKDGRAMEIVVSKLEEQIEAIEALFKGYTITTYSYHTFKFLPTNEDAKRIVARFSSDYGIVDADDLVGDPIYLTYRVTDAAPLLTEKEQAKIDKKLKGLIYRLPGRAELKVEFRGKELTTQELPIAQLGSLQSLESRIEIYDNEQIYFDTTSGAYLSTISPYIPESNTSLENQ